LIIFRRTQHYRTPHQLPAFITTREPLLFGSLVLGRAAARATKEEVNRAAAIFNILQPPQIDLKLKKFAEASVEPPDIQSQSTESQAMRLLISPPSHPKLLIRIASCRPEKSSEEFCRGKAAEMANAVAMSSLLGSKSAVAARPAAFSGKARTSRVQVKTLETWFAEAILCHLQHHYGCCKPATLCNQDYCSE
jgi:hypothetical protein